MKRSRFSNGPTLAIVKEQKAGTVTADVCHAGAWRDRCSVHEVEACSCKLELCIASSAPGYEIAVPSDWSVRPRRQPTPPLSAVQTMTEQPDSPTAPVTLISNEANTVLHTVFVRRTSAVAMNTSF